MDARLSRVGFGREGGYETESRDRLFDFVSRKEDLLSGVGEWPLLDGPGVVNEDNEGGRSTAKVRDREDWC